MPKPQPGKTHIELRQAQGRIEGSADVALVRVLLECGMIGPPTNTLVGIELLSSIDTT